MSRRILATAIATTLVGGCASLPQEEPDTTPENPAAVLETHMVSDGIKGFIPMEGTTRTWTRADMRREDATLKGTGTVSRFIVGTTESGHIERLDRKLAWTLDKKGKTYTECPLKGCAAPATPAAKEGKPEPAAEKKSEAQCTIKLASTSFTVKPTGQKRTVNGFDAEQYQVQWLITMQDAKARKTVSTLAVDVWATPVTPPLKEAMAVEQAYAKAYMAEMAGTMPIPGKPVVVPAEAAMMIDAYLARMVGPNERAAFLKAGKELEKIKGYPVLTTLTWDLKGDACAEQQDAEPKEADGGGTAIPRSAGDLISSVTQYFVKKKTDETMKEAADKPLLAFTTEVKSYRIEPVRDSVFSPPRGFKQANR